MLLALLGAAWSLLGSPIAAPQKQPVLANSLPPKEVFEGWINLFDGSTTFGWSARGAAQWEIVDGTIRGTAPAQGMGMLCTNTEFADFELRAEFFADEGANSGIMIRAPREGEITPENAYEVNIFDPHKDWPTGSINNVQKTKRKVKSVGRWTSYLIRAEGDHLTVLADGKKTVDVRDSKHARGVIALQIWGKNTIQFRNISLRPLSLQPIFNGKDLTGWKQIQTKSVITVTPKGEMNIKNGGDEIQTLKEWGNFVLQLDIFSNGDRLNSGVFFREDLGSFWTGYESQIRNQWQGDDRTKPIDFGTGGIYFHQPTRRVVPSDREWFSKTVIADGPHMAVWINGYQTADFTDKRPPHANGTARAGLRTKPGVFGLQGHDPTTDLSFRNIRAVELPAR